MLSRELTITMGINEKCSYPYYAVLTDKNDLWLGVAYGETNKDAIKKMIGVIIDGINDPAHHIWRDWD